MQPDGLEAHYDLLRAMARRLLGADPGSAMPDPTEVVHECYLRMCQAVGDGLEDPRQFRAYAAGAMRSVLVDWVRREQRLRRGGGHLQITLDEAVALVRGADSLDLLALDEALRKLAGSHPAAAQVIELRFFGGLEGEEIAQQLGVSRRTVNDRWRFGRSWLSRELGREADG